MAPPEPAPAPASRLAYLDGLRGFALIFMVLNHTARYWIDGHMTWPRYILIYVTLTLAAPTFLFLVGFCLPLSLRGRPGESESLGVLARRFVPRGVRIVLAGLLLNALVFRDEPILSGGVLQTIGFAIITMVLAIWVMRYPGARWALLAVAAAGYLTFVWSFPWLERFVDRHSLLGLVLFYDFPPWPWLSLVLVGLVMGSAWLAAYRRGEAEGARFLALTAAAGALMTSAFFVWDWWMTTPVRLGMKRDFILNNHWTPRGPSLLWVLGMLLLTLGTAYWVLERWHWRLRWLVMLGQTALFLYFAHQILVITVVNEWLGWRFNDWPSFGIANEVFLLGLVVVAWAWLRIRRLFDGLSLPLILRRTRARARP
jgi:uncharacterized membrane protein